MSYTPSIVSILHRLVGMVPDQILSDLAHYTKVWVPPHHPPYQSINSPLLVRRLAHFLGQCAHESDHFNHRYENLNYSARRLKAVFPKYFPNNTVAQQYAKCDKEIASRVYAGRMGNGDEASGDGFRFRGRGYLQLTGRHHYTRFSQFIGYDCVLDPDAVATTYPLVSALFFFQNQSLWPLCDQGVHPDIIKHMTFCINGGVQGLAQRTQYVYEFFEKMTVQ
jgi:putative chitinase